eukprot:Skav228707  [mRNA]  locus=scaffold3960:109678:110523:- [translate_table: standard]
MLSPSIIQIVAMALAVRAQQQFVVSQLFTSSDCSGDPENAVIAFEPVGVCFGEDWDGDSIPDGRRSTLELQEEFVLHRYYSRPQEHYDCCATTTIEVSRQERGEFFRCHNSSDLPGFWIQKRLVTLDSWWLDIYKMKNCTFSFSTTLWPLDLCQMHSLEQSIMHSCNGSGITINHYETPNCTGSAAQTIYYPAVTSGPCDDGPAAMVPRAACLPSTSLTPPVQGLHSAQGLCPSNTSNASDASDANRTTSPRGITATALQALPTGFAAAVLALVVVSLLHF